MLLSVGVVVSIVIDVVVVVNVNVDVGTDVAVVICSINSVIVVYGVMDSAYIT